MTIAIIISIAYIIGGLTALVLISLTIASRSDADATAMTLQAAQGQQPENTNWIG